jgi:site-specific recombinase XerD
MQERHNLPERSFHSLRHFFCSALVRGGVNVEAVRILAGHSALNVTQRYVHAQAGDLRAAVACIGATRGQ